MSIFKKKPKLEQQSNIKINCSNLTLAQEFLKLNEEKKELSKKLSCVLHEKEELNKSILSYKKVIKEVLSILKSGGLE